MGSIALEHANGSNTESQATIKKYQNQIKAAQMSLEEEQILRDKAIEGLIQAERNHHAVANQLEETKTQLEHADRQRRGAEQELSDVVEQLSATPSKTRRSRRPRGSWTLKCRL